MDQFSTLVGFGDNAGMQREPSYLAHCIYNQVSFCSCLFLRIVHTGNGDEIRSWLSQAMHSDRSRHSASERKASIG